VRRFGATLLLLAAAPLAAQQDLTARLGARVPPAVVAAAQALADTALARGLPIDPLIDKAIEGAAKGVAPERVVVALRMVFDQLGGAAAAIRGGGDAAPDAGTIEAGAFALSAGLSGAQLSALVRASTAPYTPAATLRVAGTLSAMGVPADQTTDLIRATIRNGAATAEVLSLPGRVQAQVARGQTPAQAAAGLSRAAAHGAQPALPNQAKNPSAPHRP
jgi:hypothetical protein